MEHHNDITTIINSTTTNTDASTDANVADAVDSAVSNAKVITNRGAPSNNAAPRIISPPPDVGVGTPAINIANLTLSQDFEADLGVKKKLRTIPRRKPTRQEWVRVHLTAHLATAVLILKDGGADTYLVDRELWPELAGELVQVELVLAITRQGVLFVWPIRLPSADGRVDEWSRSAMAAANDARTQWVRVVADMNLGAYQTYETTADLPEPEWPTESFEELLRIAFANHFIDDLDHPVLKRLRGEI